jgi:hypothetical protein
VRLTRETPRFLQLAVLPGATSRTGMEEEEEEEEEMPLPRTVMEMVVSPR